MDLRPTPEQSELIGVFASLYAEHSTPDHVQAAEQAGSAGGISGHDGRLWQRLLDIGVIEMAVPDEDGEVLATLLDLALVAEQHGRAVAPTPLIEALVAARLLARSGALTGDVGTVTLAVRPARAGRAELVPAGAVAEQAIVLDGDRLLLVPLAGRATAVANLADLPLADVDLAADGAEPTLLGTGPDAVALHEAAVDEWRVLTASALSGLAAKALEIGVEYVKERKAFGVPVGQFQSVAHRLADRASESDGAELLSREAAWSAEFEPDRFRALAAMALAFSAETAIATSHDALHFHGGYGFMLEYSIQLYYRRARGWAAVLESPGEGYRRVAGEHLAAVASGEGAA